MMKIEIREYTITARMWVVAIVAWFVTTISCTLYTTRKFSVYSDSLKTDHQLLMQLETFSRKESLDKDIEVRKRLIELQASLSKIQEQQDENMKKIEAIKRLQHR